MSIHPKEIHCGEMYYECFNGSCVKMKAITEPYVREGSWQWKARDVEDGQIVDYVWLGNGYGPSLYEYPAYGVNPEAFEDDYVARPKT